MLNKRLLKFSDDSIKYVFISVLLKCISLLLNISFIFILSHIFNTREIKSPLISVFIILCLLSNFICTEFTSLFSFFSSKKIKIKLRTKIYEKLLRLGMQYKDKIETAKVITLAVEGVEQLEIWFGAYLPQFFYSIIAALTTFTVISFFNLKTALVLLICIPLIPLSIIAVQNIAKKFLFKYWNEYENLADNFLENMQGLTTLLIYKADEYKQKKMSEEAENFRKVTMKVLSMQLNSIVIMDLIAYGGAGLGIAASVIAFQNNQIPLESCMICILLSADFFIPLRRLGSYFHTALNGTTAAKNIFNFLEMEEKKDGKEIVCVNSFNNVIFECFHAGYSYNEKKILENCNISIANGSFVAFIGKSGSGKSTLAKIFAGINRNYSGFIKLNGTELCEISQKNIHEYVSYISHKDWIFKGSLRETLLEGKLNATDEEMWKVLEKVQLQEFAKKHNGLETEISENAVNLSGGQKQRLSIARALLHDTKVIIFDEATSNVDVESEKAIVELLHNLKRKKTIIMISHREENCRNADYLYYFSDGKIIKSQKSSEQIEA